MSLLHSLALRANVFDVTANATSSPAAAAAAANHDTSERGTTVRAVCVSVYSIAALVIAARMYVRGFVVRWIGADDWLIVVGFITAGVNVTLIILQVDAGLGRHHWDQAHIKVIPFMKLAWSYMIIYGITIWAIKMSILLLYHRLAPSRTHRLVLNLLMATITLYTIALTLAQIFQCTPIRRSYQPGFPKGCIDVNAMNLTTAVFNIVTDFVILVLPIRSIAGLKVQRGKRVALYGILGLGGLAVVAAAVRFGALVSWLKTSELLWSVSPAILCSDLEVNIGLITASLPSLQPLFKRCFETSRKVLTNPRTASGSNGHSSKLGNNSNSFGLRSMNKSANSGGGGDYKVRVKGGNGLGMRRLEDGVGSEEAIVKPGTVGSEEDAEGGFRVEKTTEVRVEYGA